MTNKLLTSALFLFITVSAMWAQDKGSFVKTIEFNAENRAIAFYVPNDYSPDSTYGLLIGLHGMGDAAANYRNALINSLKWNEIFDSYIIACPDGGSDQGKDFHLPLGDELIIEEVIKYTESNYNINDQEIILQGFSLGGRSALKYGLENTERFKALFLTTPAIQGQMDANNAPEVNFGFAYTNASKIPIYLTLGAKDDVYIPPVNKTIDYLIKNNAVLAYNIMPNIGHSLPNKTITTEAFSFLNNPLNRTADAEIRNVSTNALQCSEWVSASCLVRNLGAETINSVKIEYGKDGDKNEFTWKGKLEPFEHVNIECPDFELDNNEQEIEVIITEINGKTDNYENNNKATTTTFVSTKGLELPFEESFEGDISQWTSNTAGNLFEWYKDNEEASLGNNSLSAFNTILIFTTIGQVETISSPVLDLSTLKSPSISFDLAYNYHVYTPPYVTEETVFADTLIVSISTDCGKTNTELFKKGGIDLATVSQPILNPLSVQQVFFAPTPQEWKEMSLGLQEFDDAKNAIISFSYKSAMGGNIYIDNIRFDNYLSADQKNAAPEYSIYPNPSSGTFNIAANAPLEKIDIYDSKGVLVYSKEKPNSLEPIAANNFQNGMYFISLFNGKNYIQKTISIIK
ncbi:MAG: T9SS type A sorting domain-containing protein [Bacteroidia bacterium]